MNIYLIGYRCSGKTTIGRLLAVKTGSFFFDTDEQLAERYGITITGMVSRYGWAYFRAKEKEILSEISLENGCIVATGGGIVLDSGNVFLMKRTGIVVWLRTEIGTIKNWILNDCKTADSRPSLTGKKLVHDIEETFNLRVDIYKSVSDFSVSTDSFNLNTICGYIVRFILEQADF